MKKENVYFHCRNNEVDSELVKAIEVLPEEGMLILPRDADWGCMKKDGKIVIYPYDPNGKLITMHHIAAEEYVSCLKYSRFKIKEFSYEVLRNNPFKVYERVIEKGLYDQVMEEEKEKEQTLEDCIVICTSRDGIIFPPKK